MRREFHLGIVLVFATLCPALGALPLDQGYWSPDLQTIARLESQVHMPVRPSIPGTPAPSPHKLTDYDRFYSGVIINGHQDIRAVYVLPPDPWDNPKPGIHVVDHDRLPKYPGGGCGVLTLFVVLEVMDRGVYAGCNLIEASAPQGGEPYWAPDEETITQMEGGLILPTLGGFRTYPLGSYARYYIGATENGHRVIRGRLDSSDKPAGIHIVGDRDDPHLVGPLGGGCGNIRITYDLDDRKLLYAACYGLG